MGDGVARVRGDDSTAYAARRARGAKGQGALLQFDAVGLPQLFAETLHIVPHFDGTVAIGSTTERHFDDPSCDG